VVGSATLGSRVGLGGTGGVGTGGDRGKKKATFSAGGGGMLELGGERALNWFKRRQTSQERFRIINGGQISVSRKGTQKLTTGRGPANPGMLGSRVRMFLAGGGEGVNIPGEFLCLGKGKMENKMAKVMHRRDASETGGAELIDKPCRLAKV